MSTITTTSASLLEALRDSGDDRRWTEFHGRYYPVLVASLRRSGLRPEEAEDVAQETLLTFADAYRQGKYDPKLGRLRNWLFGIARKKVLTFQEKRARSREVAWQSDAAELVHADHADPLRIWEEECERAIAKACLEELRRISDSVSMRIFQLYALENNKARAVAAQLGVSIGLVFQKKHRMLDRLRELRKQFEESW